jgi:molybdopterin-guanine dinucleotide biosynthesis protein A
MVKGVILAGGKNRGELYEFTRVENKAFIKIAEKEMIDYVIQAMENTKEIEEFVVVGEEEKLRERVRGKLKKIIPAKDTMLENIFSALEYYRDEKKILFLGSDAPLVKSFMIEEFLKECERKEGDIYYPIIEKNIIEEKFPAVKRTYARVKEGIFTGGNMFLLNPEALFSFKHLLEEVIGKRKSPFKLFKMLGIFFIIKFLLGRLSIPEAEKRVEEILKGYKMVAIICKNPEVGFDVDKVLDLKIVRKYLEEK